MNTAIASASNDVQNVVGKIGTVLVSTGILAIGAIMLRAGLLPETLFPESDLPVRTVQVSGAVLILTVAARLSDRLPKAMQLPVPLFWAASLLTALAAALTAWQTPVAWVGVVEATVLFLVTTAWATEPLRRFGTLAPLAAAAMLMLFGYVHVSQAEALSSLLPAWLPNRSWLPYVSGTLLAVAAIAGCFPRARSVAYGLVAAMFMSWLPLVHLPRLIVDPGSAAEWHFASGALLLAGALLIIAARDRTD